MLAIDPAVPISCMFIGASVANSASYGTVRAPFDQCCGLTVTLKIFVQFFPLPQGDSFSYGQERVSDGFFIGEHRP